MATKSNTADYTEESLYTVPARADYTWAHAKKGFLVTKEGMCGISYDPVGIINWNDAVYVVRPEYVGVIDTLFMEPTDVDKLTLGKMGDLYDEEMAVGGIGGVYTFDTHQEDVLEWDNFYDGTLGRIAQPFVAREDYAFHFRTAPINAGFAGAIKHFYSVEIEHDCEQTVYVCLWTRDTPHEDWLRSSIVPLAQPDTVAGFSCAGRECEISVYGKNFTRAVFGRITLGFKIVDSRFLSGSRRPMLEAQ